VGVKPGSNEKSKAFNTSFHIKIQIKKGVSDCDKRITITDKILQFVKGCDQTITITDIFA